MTVGAAQAEFADAGDLANASQNPIGPSFFLSE
jgi:hypothetical protein